MRYHLLSLCLLLLWGVTSCNKEDDLFPEPDNTISYFLPDSEDDSEEAELRRNFYQEEKTFLLYNDTLWHELLGIGTDGKSYYRTETIDISYSVGNSTSSAYTYTYDYLTTLIEKQMAVSFLKENIMLHLGEQLRPFSWLVIKKITETSLGVINTPTVVSGERCIALALGEIESLSESDRETLGKNMIMSILSGIIATKDEQMEEFYEICDDLYDMRFATDFDVDHDVEQLRTDGFIIRGTNPWTGRPMMGKYPSKTADLESYMSLVLNSTSEEVITLYGSYANIMLKYNALKKIIEDLGYII